MSRNIESGLEILSRHWVGSVEFVVTSPSRAVDHVISMAVKGGGRHVHLANAYTVALADKSSDYRKILASPAVNFADGKPIGWVSALRGQSPRLEQVRGPQLFLDVFDRGRAQNVRHYLLGSTPEVLALLQQNLLTQFPGVSVVGMESPPFRKLTKIETASQDLRIAKSGAQIVWVGLGTPKQDIEALRIAATIPVVVVAIGAAFDFTAGTLAEAPKWMRRLGLEWVFRLSREPRRLWRRYLFGNVRFLKAALRADSPPDLPRDLSPTERDGL